MASQHISRDPFARTELHRRTIPKAQRKPDGCRWCGSEGRYMYRIEADTIKPRNMIGWHGPFCSISCYRSFHE